MNLQYIQANGRVYWLREAGVQDPHKHEGCHYPVCYIKKLWFGRWQIDMWDDDSADWSKGVGMDDDQHPNTRIILYPSGIEEIKYLIK